MIDKQAAKRECKENRPPAGVYVVENRENGKVFIGSSRNLPAILNRHRAELRTGGHRNQALLADWRQFGEAAFVFRVLDELEPDQDRGIDDADLRELERMWREKLGPPAPRFYNRA